MDRMEGRRATCAAALLALLAACSLLVPQRHDDVQRELSRNRALWRSQGVTSYEYVVRRLCFCDPDVVAPVRVRVRDGRVTALAYAEGGGSPDPQRAGLWPPVEGLFDAVQDAIDSDAHSITVEYHPQMGYPTNVFIDYQANVADEEQGFTAGDLVGMR